VAVEAASIARRRPPRKRRRSRAWLAALLYVGLAAVAVVLVASARRDDLPALGSSDAGEGQATVGGGADELALDTIGARAQRSTVGVGGGTGFVAWESPGLTLVLTARPAGGWTIGADRGLAVSYDGRSWPGTLVRADPKTGLGLVRVARVGIATPLWNTAERTATRAGEVLAVVGRRGARTVAVERAGRRRLYLGTTGLGSLAGAPVLNTAGRLVGVLDSGGGAVPIARACGVIRRC
jgi:S1-C subfamily serine protease